MVFVSQVIVLLSEILGYASPLFTPLITAISLILGPTLHPEIVAAQDQLKSPSEIEKLSYDDAIARVNDIIAEENSTNDIRPECHSIMKDHGKKTDKAVVLIHGVSGCPAHFAELADKFYDEGYNVFIPRMPKHGLTDNNRHGEVTLAELASFAEQTTSILSGLGEEAGVAGSSGGSSVATWIAQYGKGTVKKLLLLEPFYATYDEFQNTLVKKVYGWNLLPDILINGNLSLRALGKYLLLVDSYKPDMYAPGVESISVILSEGDKGIDHNEAANVSKKMADSSGAEYQYVELPKSMGLEHGIINPGDPLVIPHKEKLYDMYYKAYTGEKVSALAESNTIEDTEKKEEQPSQLSELSLVLEQ